MSDHRKVLVELVPNDRIRNFWVTSPIASESLYDTFPGANGLRFSVADHTADTIKTALRFYDTDGVASVGLDIYKVRITIASGCDWRNIQPEVVNTICELLQWDTCSVRERVSGVSAGQQFQNESIAGQGTDTHNELAG